MLRDIFAKGPNWELLRHFTASSKYCRSHEVAVLNGLAKRVLLCTEEVGANKLAAEMEKKYSSEEYPSHTVIGRTEQQYDMDRALVYLRYA